MLTAAPTEFPPDAGLPRSVQRAIKSDLYVDYRELALVEKSQEYRISPLDWANAHTKYVLLRGEHDPEMLWKLTAYQALIFTTAKR